METRANYALVGLFTLGVLAAAFAFVYWFSGLGAASKREAIRIVFSGTVTGLGRGSSVLFNGLRVGEVTDIRLLPDDPKRIYVTVEVDRTTPVRVDTRARIEAQGLAGVVAVQMIGGEPSAGFLEAGPGQPMPTIFAERSEFQDLLETVRTIARRADDVMDKVEKVINDNAPAVTRTISNVEKFSNALGNNADGVDKLMASVAQAAQQIGPLAQRLDTLSLQVSQVIATIDPQKITRSLDNIDKFTSALGGSGPDVQSAVKDVASITKKLNSAADQVEGVLKAAQAFLGSAAGGEGTGAFGEIAATAKSIRILADNLDGRTAQITAGINRFTGPGLRDIEALATDGRRTLGDLNRTLRNLERNPQQFIFGGRPPIPQYNGTR
jgi:phospholipid/cholesterol/gamma-HCH transport system substrate-binding protein